MLDNDLRPLINPLIPKEVKSSQFPNVHAWTFFAFFSTNEGLPFDEFLLIQTTNMTVEHLFIEWCSSQNHRIKRWLVSRKIFFILKNAEKSPQHKKIKKIFLGKIGL